MEDGGLYYGEWSLEQNNRHGRGIFLQANDKPNGKGKYIQDQLNFYEGSFLNGKFNGHGKLVENGSTYEGEFKDDKQEGIGKEKWQDGAVYEGEYKNGVKCGKGKFIWDSGTIYEGQFDNNQINGQGKYIFSDGRKYLGNLYIFRESYYNSKNNTHFTCPHIIII